MSEQNAFNVETHIENLKRHKSAGIGQILFEVFKVSFEEKEIKMLRIIFGPMRKEVKGSG